MAQEQHGTYPQNWSPGRSCSLFAPPLTRVRATGLARGQDPVAIEENALVHTKRRPLLLPLCIEITFRRITRQLGRAGSRRLGQLLRAGKGAGRKAYGTARCGRIRRRSCRRADGAPARGGRSHEKVKAGEPRLFAPGRRKSGWAGERQAAPGVFRGVLHALQEQLWGHFLHNRALVHRKGGRLRLIPVGDTLARGVGTQACDAPKFLARQGKKGLSTERSHPYYYHYLFIKKTKKKTGQPEDRGRGRCEDGEQSSARAWW